MFSRKSAESANASQSKKAAFPEKNYQDLLKRQNQISGRLAKTFDQDSSDECILLNENDRKILEQIERAIYRYQQGVYGICESCRKKIPRPRLNNCPESTMCVGCQKKSELGALQGSQRENGASWARVDNLETTTAPQPEVNLSDIED